MVSGSFLLSFSLFMLSLSKPEKFYQASRIRTRPLPPQALQLNKNSQIFLSHGLGAGLGAGLSYIPSIGIVTQHFHTPHSRALVMGIVASGSSLGGLLHPIMLNNLFHGHVGFANGVRASAGLITGLQVIALLLMRPKYAHLKRKESNEEGQTSEQSKMISVADALRKFSRDMPYVAITIGYILSSQTRYCSPLMTTQIGFLLPRPVFPTRVSPTRRCPAWH